jgi:serine/threonine protein kinase
MNKLSDDQVRHLRDLVDAPDLSGTRYEIVRRLAAGGMATVFLVRDRELEREVALKVLTVADQGGELVKRMLREAQIVARLEHPGIVPIHDVGRLPDGRVFYTMKYVEGVTLEQFASPARTLPELVRVLQRVCEALAFAHAHGVLHRDLKPSNIMIGAFGEVLVMDWGIARRASDTESTPNVAAGNDHPATDTAPGMALGTPAYMAPEQALGRPELIDQRTDVYGLGGVLYFILTGHAPKSGSGEAEIIPPRTHDRKIPRRIEAICLRALAADPRERYPDVTSFADDLDAFLAGESVSAYPETIFERVGRWTQRNQLVVILILVYLLVRVLFLFWRHA